MPEYVRKVYFRKYFKGKNFVKYMKKELNLTTVGIGIFIIGILAFLSSQITGHMIESNSDEIIIRDGEYFPQNLTISSGQRIFWENREAEDCLIMFSNSTRTNFLLEPESIKNLKFNEPGYHRFYCKGFDMRGYIRVE